MTAYDADAARRNVVASTAGSGSYRGAVLATEMLSFDGHCDPQ
jgi:hypothetical protein